MNKYIITYSNQPERMTITIGTKNYYEFRHPSYNPIKDHLIIKNLFWIIETMDPPDKELAIEFHK